MSYLLISFCISCSSLGAGQEKPVVVPIQDKSELYSPLQVSGEVSISETVQANQVSATRGELVKVRNISEKAILLFVASLIDAGPRSSRWDVDLTTDNFFKDKALLPGDEVTVWQRSLGDGFTVEPFRSATGEGRPPIAEFRLQFVQFADGSTVGDSEVAKEYIDSRESKLLFLRTLDDAYRAHGESGLLEALEQYPSAKRPYALWSQIRDQQRANGTEASVLFVRHLISIATQHETALRSAIATK
jgi:hypothetical protein